MTLAELLDGARRAVRGRRPRAITGLAFRARGRTLVTDRPPAEHHATSTRCRSRPGTSWTSTATGDAWRRHGYFSMNMVTTRGCPFHCNWCAKPIWGQRYTVRSPENVADEIAWLKRHVLARTTSGSPTTSSASSPAGSRPFADCRRGPATRVIPFKCLRRADLLLRAGRRRGARATPAARRSGWAPSRARRRSSTRWRRGPRVEQIREAAARLRAAGIQVGFFLQFGYPGETRGRRSRRPCAWSRVRCRTTSASRSRTRCPARRSTSASGPSSAAKQNWVDSDDLAMLYAGRSRPAFYRRLHGVVHASSASCARPGPRRPGRTCAARSGGPGPDARSGGSAMPSTLPVDRLLLDVRARLDGGARRPPPGGRPIRVIPPGSGDPAA